MFITILGTVTDEKDTSLRAKWLRKKYMGVWRRESSLFNKMMNRFRRIVVIYMRRKRAKNMPCFSGWMGSPRRKNSDTLLWFILLMLFLPKLGIDKSVKCQ